MFLFGVIPLSTEENEYYIGIGMKMNKNNKKKNNNYIPTNGWDVLKSCVDGLFNFMSLPKVGAFALFWFIVRDIIYVINLPEDFNYAANLLEAKNILEYIFQNDNIILEILILFCIFLLICVVSLICHNIYLRKEIKRIAQTRSDAMHREHKLHQHTSSAE